MGDKGWTYIGAVAEWAASCAVVEDGTLEGEKLVKAAADIQQLSQKHSGFPDMPKFTRDEISAAIRETRFCGGSSDDT